MTIIVTTAIIKGGSAKTTTTMAIARILARRGEKVTVLDTDNTGGATLWAQYVAEENETRHEAKPDAEEYELGFDVLPANQATVSNPAALRRKYDGWVLIDTPPSDTGVVKAAMDAADIVIIPCQPSVSDLTHAGKTYAQANGRGLVLLTRVKPRTRLAQEAIESLDNGQVTRFDTYISEREAIKNLYGTTQVDNQQYSSVVEELMGVVKQLGLEA